jgi:hypothetical protein
MEFESMRDFLLVAGMISGNSRVLFGIITCEVEAKDLTWLMVSATVWIGLELSTSHGTQFLHEVSRGNPLVCMC